MPNHPTIAIVIAAYNEGEAIEDVLRPLVEEYSIVAVVDDGSSDNTAEVARRAGAHIISHPINLGQGAALQTGIDYALGRGVDFIVTFDADGQHNRHDIAPTVAALKRTEADVALGSRFLGEAIGLDWKKKHLLKAAIAFTNWTSGACLTDVHNGFRVFTRAGASKIRIRQNRMAHASEIVEQAVRRSLHIIEVPVTITYTAYSKAKGQRISNSGNILIDLALGRLFR
jgi:glycosyltransferase involved in cell wall biosynthesis